MAQRPVVIAFDVIETLSRSNRSGHGSPGPASPATHWSSGSPGLLRDAFALTAAGGYRPFPEVAASALAAVTRDALTDGQVRQTVAGFRDLDPHPDTEPALRAARDAGIRVVTLTNGSAQNTSALLDRAGLRRYVERVISVDEVRRWKPAPEPYRHAAAGCDVPPEGVALVAAHGWDVHGARHAGLTTGWVSRLEGRFPAVYHAADVTGDDLVSVVGGLLRVSET